MTARDDGRVHVRPATVDDAGLLAAAVIEGMQTYRSFSPAGWDPPPVEREREVLRTRLEAGAWAQVALEDDVFAGHVLFIPADGVPGCAHLGGLFVVERWWGSGLAARLLALAVAEMRAQGYERARLFTPELQARARRFYEREGWQLRSGPFAEPAFGLDLVEYGRPLRSAASRG